MGDCCERQSPLSCKKARNIIAPGIHSKLQGIFAGQRGQAVRVVLAPELFLHRQGHHTKQSRQQNPHHITYPPDHLVHIVQETLQTSSFTIYYILVFWKNKMTMQEIMKKCFSSVLAFRLQKKPMKQSNCILGQAKLQSAAADGGSGRRSMPRGIIQVNVRS